MTEHKPWLSLPDEDPPERGLAELMAAARMKAEVMANPPWWKRLFVVMRRPPVLALATAVVVVCGVIVVGRGRNPQPPQRPHADETKHEDPRVEKLAAPQVNETKDLDDATTNARAESQALEQGEATKAPAMGKAGQKAPDPLARCRAAAARRDCAAAKACVEGAPASTKASAKDDAALKSCL